MLLDLDGHRVRTAGGARKGCALSPRRYGGLLSLRFRYER